MQVRDEERLIEEIMTTYAKLPPEKKRMFMDFLQSISEVYDNEKSPVPEQREQGKHLAEGQ